MKVVVVVVDDGERREGRERERERERAEEGRRTLNALKLQLLKMVKCR